MGGRDRAKALERERSRRAQQATPPPDAVQPARTPREAARTCAWCGEPLRVLPIGRIPTWCSQSCRQRAWEQRRAAASGRSAVTVVERVIAAPAPAAKRPRPRDWPVLLTELADHLDHGRIYRRDLPSLAIAFDRVIAAFRRASR